MLKANTGSTEALSLARSATATARGEALLSGKMVQALGGTHQDPPEMEVRDCSAWTQKTLTYRSQVPF